MMKSIPNATYRIVLASFFIFFVGAVALYAAAGTTYYVSPAGSDANSGIASDAPFKTVQKALDTAQAGDTIELSSGEYRQDFLSRRDGTALSPITIKGPADAIVRGGGNDRVIEINHDYHILDGFTVNGLHGTATSPSGYRDILIFVHGKQTRSGVEGLKVTNMTLKNAGGECLRLRYFVTGAEVARNTITDCGVLDFVFKAGGKNGEGIYIGTSSEQWGDGKNPTSDPDESKGNHVHDNTIDTKGNECVDIKEGATENIIEYNTCRGQKDSESGGFGSRGSGNIFRYNDVRGSVGAGIRVGGWTVSGVQYGKNNDMYENTIMDNQSGGIKFQVTPQGKVCGNIMANNTGGNSVGTYAAQFNPVGVCGGSPPPPPPPPPPSPSPSPSPTPPPPPSPSPSAPATNSLVNSKTLIAHSNNFSSGWEEGKLWDGCYEGSLYNSDTCTSGGRDIASFWLEFDFGKLYKLSQARLYGDTEGTWVSKTWTLQYRESSAQPWTAAFSEKNALVNSWLSEPLDMRARYVRVEVFGDSVNYSPGRTQARELEIYGTEDTQSPVPNPPSSQGGGSSPQAPPISTGSSGGSSGGGGGGGGTPLIPKPEETVKPKEQGASVGFIEGALVKAMNAFKVFLIKAGKLLHIPNPAAFIALGLSWGNVREVAPSDVAGAKEITLQRGAGDFKVYTVRDGKKLHIPSAEGFNKAGHKWEDIVEVQKGFIENTPDAMLIRASDSQKVYKVEKGQLRWVTTLEIFNRMKLNWADVVVVDSKELYYPIGEDIT